MNPAEDASCLETNMNVKRAACYLGLCALTLADLRGSEVPARAGLDELFNFWPFVVTSKSPETGRSGAQHLGPLVETRSEPGASLSVLRPLYLHRDWPAEQRSETDYLYPIFVYKRDASGSGWSLVNLINSHTPQEKASRGPGSSLDVWPFYFSRDTGRPEDSYSAFFPVYGTMYNRLGSDRLHWTLFPLYGSSLKGQRLTQAMPWPFLKTIEGGGWHGWSVWPLGGTTVQTGKSQSWYALWPLLYGSRTQDENKGLSTTLGILPFYAADDAPGYRSRSYLWPFLGTTERTQPYHYSEQRYLWPFFMQGRGDDRYRNRWAPFYTHSVGLGSDKTWVLWPLWRDETTSGTRLVERKSQLLYFVYWNLQQRQPGAPATAPTARKTHLWPLFSSWDNGSGRKQVQALSPVEVFFPHNEQVRLSWSPLFALYRYDQAAPGQTRHSLLWNAISYQRNRPADASRFPLGPLFRSDKAPSGDRVAFLGGLLSFRRPHGQGHWKISFADFKAPPNPPLPTSQP